MKLGMLTQRHAVLLSFGLAPHRDRTDYHQFPLLSGLTPPSSANNSPTYLCLYDNRKGGKATMPISNPELPFERLRCFCNHFGGATAVNFWLNTPRL